MFDMLGNEIQTLFNGYQPKGSHAIVVDVSGRSKIKNTLSSGIYFYSLRMNGFVCTKKMMVLK